MISTILISNISYAEPFFNILEKFHNLKSLNLENNHIKFLPSNLSAFNKMTKINVSNNSFESFDNVIASLQTIPNLNTLSISLENNIQVKKVVESFPKILYLNGEKITQKDKMTILSIFIRCR